MKLYGLALFGCLFAGSMSAGAITDCTPQPLSMYVANQTACQIGPLQFSNFEYGAGHFPDHPGPPAFDILVTPQMDPADPGIAFSSRLWTAAGAGGGGDSVISFLIMSLSGEPLISGVGLDITGAVDSEPVKLIVGETVCVGVMIKPGACPAANTVNLQVADTPSPIAQLPYASFGPVSEITVFKDIYFASDAETGSGRILTVSNNYPVPEPATPLLSLCGLLAAWRLAKRRRAR
jgi:hypothetical protein